MKWLRTIGGIAVAAGVIFGWKFYNKFNTASEVKGKLLAVCEDNSQCVGAVNKHFDTCFEAHYNLGGRRRSGYLKGAPFTDCLNAKAGTVYFRSQTQ